MNFILIIEADKIPLLNSCLFSEQIELIVILKITFCVFLTLKTDGIYTIERHKILYM